MGNHELHPSRFLRLLLLGGCLILAAQLQPGKAAPPSTVAEFPPELVRFTPYNQNPVFTAAPGQWDAKIRERGWIMRDGEHWHLWYTGYDGTREGIKLLGHATSADGLSWTRVAANPLDREHW